jgi:hypothetical protein
MPSVDLEVGWCHRRARPGSGIRLGRLITKRIGEPSPKPVMPCPASAETTSANGITQVRNWSVSPSASLSKVVAVGSIAAVTASKS